MAINHRSTQFKTTKNLKSWPKQCQAQNQNENRFVLKVSRSVVQSCLHRPSMPIRHLKSITLHRMHVNDKYRTTSQWWCSPYVGPAGSKDENSKKPHGTCLNTYLTRWKGCKVRTKSCVHFRNSYSSCREPMRGPARTHGRKEKRIASVTEMNICTRTWEET